MGVVTQPTLEAVLDELDAAFNLPILRPLFPSLRHRKDVPRLSIAIQYGFVFERK